MTVKLPVIILGIKSGKSPSTTVRVLAPTDALNLLNSSKIDDNDIKWVFDGSFECGIQKIVDCLIEQPGFFKALDKAIDSRPYKYLVIQKTIYGQSETFQNSYPYIHKEL